MRAVTASRLAINRQAEQGKGAESALNGHLRSSIARFSGLELLSPEL